MPTLTEYIEINSMGNRDIIDITPQLIKFLNTNNIENGLLTIFVPGSTAGITTIEFEPGLKKDLDLFLEKIIPYAQKYYHHDTWHDDNGSSHIQAAIIGPSLSIPFLNKELTLGTWQQVVLVDCDTRARKRKVIIQILS